MNHYFPYGTKPNTIEGYMNTLLYTIEGEKFTNNPNDRGGPTKWGITQTTLDSYRATNEKELPEDFPVTVGKLGHNHALQIYSELYMAPFLSMCQYTPHLIVLTDIAVNSGVPRSVMILQSALNELHDIMRLANPLLREDGVLGPVTRDMYMALTVSEQDRINLTYALVQLRMHWYIDIVMRRPSQLEFLRGWYNRVQLLDPLRPV